MADVYEFPLVSPSPNYEDEDDDDMELLEMICLFCTARWYEPHCAEMSLKDVGCPSCRRAGGVIYTGEVVET
jgi:hypothetical protein